MPNITLTPQQQAQDIASLAGWVIFERRFLAMLTDDCGLSLGLAWNCMQEEN